MTNQEKFIEIFGIDAWMQMIVFSGLADQFKEYWTSPYNVVNTDTKIDGKEYSTDFGYARKRD